MDLSRQLKLTALICFLITLVTQSVHTRYHGRRHKRQNGAHLYLPESFIIPEGEGSDPNEWSPWSSPSECSRSCGGGVAYQTRECLNFAPNGAPLCKGGNRKYYSCNTQDCPEDESDFRAQQCSRFNSIPFDGIRYEWVPYTKAPNPCELNCMPRGERFYYRHKAKVIDGTRCNDQSLDVCVDGKCEPVGCDMMLGSSAREDKCRKCAGDGSSCRTVSGFFDMNNLQVGYNDILLIPAGATNIDIHEVAPSNNYFACRNLTGHYYLNGNWRIDFPRPMFFAGTWWHYDRRPQGFAAPDRLTCLGPTIESIYIVLLYQDRNVGIQYEYSVPENAVKSPEPDTYSWTYTAFAPCSASCGGGYQTRNVTCNSRTSLEEVDESLCDSTTKPADTQQCGQEECAPRWVESPWGKCSKPCGSEGKQERTVHCEKIASNGVATEVEDSVCLEQVGNKPATVQECNLGSVCPKWHIGPWQPCTKLCGEGTQKRKVTCYKEDNGKKKILNDAECMEDKPETDKICILQPCEGVDWITSSWSGCNKCGLTHETRTATCASKSGKVYNESFCPPQKPELKRSCKLEHCIYQWFTSQWSACSAKCGKGVQDRIVICGQFDGKVVTPAEDDKCDSDKKPESSQECEAEIDECPGEWFVGPWSACTKPCGGGEWSREVLCLSNGKVADNCNSETIEFASEKCNTDPCTDDGVIPVDSTGKPIEGEDEGGEECDEDDEDVFGVEFITTPARKDELKISEGVDLDGRSTTETSLLSDDLMMSDATGFELESTASDDSTPMPESTFEGSGEETSLGVSEGSGDSTISIEATSEPTDQSTVSSDVSGSTSSEAATESSASTDIASGATDVSGSTDASSSTDLSGSTDVSTEESATTDASSDSSSSEASSPFSGSTDTSASTDLSADTTAYSSSEPSTDTSLDLSSVTTEGSTLESSSPSSPGTDSTPSSTSDSSTTDESTSDASTPTSSETDASSTEGSTLESSITTESGSSVTTDMSGSTESSGSTDSSSAISTVTGSDETTVSGTTVSGSTEITETTASGSTEESVSTESTVEQTTVSGSTEETETTVSGSTEESETTVSGSTEETETTVSGSTEEAETTVSGSTEEPGSTESTVEQSTLSTEEPASTVSGSTEESGSTESTVEGTTTSDIEVTTIDIWGATGSEVTDESGEDLTTPNTLQAAITKEQKPRKCKPKKKTDCTKTEFGCCPDNTTIAKGPFDEGCPIAETCKDTKYGCCPDGLSPAKGNNNKGCPKSQCAETLFGCCPDNWTPAEGDDNEGCPEPTTTTVGGCAASEFGCCSDGVSEASGPNNQGCEVTTEAVSEGTTEPAAITTEGISKSCSFAKYGCCPDGETEATGENFQGCHIVDEKDCSNSLYGCCKDNKTSATGPDGMGCEPCVTEPFGCCPDGRNPAHGHNREGCCIDTPFGCCPDNINAARGPNYEGCDCNYSPYGCCPDNKTAARGYNNEGCGCEVSQFGCCPDKITPAQGEKFAGCPCHSFQFGCCPDGITVPQGPHNYGCHCSQTELKCCADEISPAKGPNGEGCTCAESKYGCCPDGVTEAKGKKFEGCENVEEPVQKSCALNKDLGPCNNFTVKYFFDTVYGACVKFWYGGCDGNGNRFDTLEECKSMCEDYKGKETCLLPRSSGPCTGVYKKYYFDSERNTCTEFNYGGCFGNTNRFDTIAECQSACAFDESLPPCEQPVDRGPCGGNYERWYYDNETDVCRSFAYGGCKGNKNNYASEHACNYHCKKPGVHRESCALPKVPGECDGRFARWYYSESDKKCMPFYYTGCGGNENNYVSLEQCEERCPKQVAKDICEIPAEVGECQNYEARWYFDTKEQRCRQFYYGGCGGNQNNFANEQACLQRCEKRPEPTKQTTVTPAGPVGPVEPVPEGEFRSEYCFIRPEQGNCGEYQPRWYYNSDEGICDQYAYSGCGGNANSFLTEEECENNCGHVQNTCSLRPIYGRCTDNTTRWYYDERTGRCHEFEFSGCRGNRNNFFTEQDCLDFCSTGHREEPIRTEAPESVDHCTESMAAGDCDEQILSWFYNNERRSCEAFYYTGCKGNRNRFESQEQCDRQCGEYKGRDVCHEPLSVGRCEQWQTRYYYDPSSRICQPFAYSGCEGTGNRFVSQTECEAVCIVREEPSGQSDREICYLPVQVGRCSDDDGVSSRRWYYDDDRGTCVPFIYSGCAGNQNNFRSFESCIELCSNPDEHHNVPGELRTEGPDLCETYREQCRTMHCPYGVRRSYGDDGCERCECENPCAEHRCSEGYSCAVDFSTDQSSGSAFAPVCRLQNKPGECPTLSNSSRCDRECYNDADCRGDSKCCYDGCGHVCVLPAETQVITTTAQPQVVYPGDRPPALEQRPQHEIDVDSPAGSAAVLRCFATGNPAPTITWRRGEVIINTNQGRYILTASGDLTIVRVHRSDSGTYVCVADNGLGAPVTREIKLDVLEPKPTDAYIIGPRNSTKIVTLRQPFNLRCLAGGHPKPVVTWWRGKNRLPLTSARFEVNRDYSLMFHSIQLSDLGTYTCEAWAGHGRPASIQITLKAIGPVHVTNKEDEKYLKYLIDPPSATTTPRGIPQYPYRPTRPHRPVPPIYYTTTSPPRPARPQVPASALLKPDEGNTYAVGSDVVLNCEVDGHPTPNVTWYKDEVELSPSSRIQITEQPYRLVVYGVTTDDTGHYACSARNSYGYNTHKELISIEGVYVHPDCVDNQFFANCALIVKGKYCNSNPFYAKFCCRSCTLAGQLQSTHPNSLTNYS